MKLQHSFNDQVKSFSQKRFGVSIRASVADQSNATADGVTWLLEPVGQ